VRVENCLHNPVVALFASGVPKLRPTFASEVPIPKVSSYEIDFRLNGEMFKVTHETAAAARMFGISAR
jgi:hypothetical protein